MKSINIEPGLTQAVVSRFWSKVIKTDTGCWDWADHLDRNGYGHFGLPIAGTWKDVLAHRVSYTIVYGHIPDGAVLDHVECRRPSCVRPDHLQPVTQRVNVLRGDNPMAVQARKTHCVRGHEFTPGNTVRYAGNPRRRYCLACQKQRNRK